MTPFDSESLIETVKQVEKEVYRPRPIIMWKLSRKDATRIACPCGRPARYGRTADGGAPYFYECSKHIPVGVPVEMCASSAEIVAAVEAKNELMPKKASRKPKPRMVGGMPEADWQRLRGVDR